MAWVAFATNPLGTRGLRPHASLLVVNDATNIVSSSRLAWDSQAPCARPMRLLGDAPGLETHRPGRSLEIIGPHVQDVAECAPAVGHAGRSIDVHSGVIELVMDPGQGAQL